MKKVIKISINAAMAAALSAVIFILGLYPTAIADATLKIGSDGRASLGICKARVNGDSVSQWKDSIIEFTEDGVYVEISQDGFSDTGRNTVQGHFSEDYENLADTKVYITFPDGRVIETSTNDKGYFFALYDPTQPIPAAIKSVIEDSRAAVGDYEITIVGGAWNGGIAEFTNDGIVLTAPEKEKGDSNTNELKGWVYKNDTPVGGMKIIAEFASGDKQETMTDRNNNGMFAFNAETPKPQTKPVSDGTNASPSPTVRPSDTPKQMSYPDVDETYWAYESIRRINELGGFKGYDDGSFKPDNRITHEELLTVVMSLMYNGDIAEAPSSIIGEAWADWVKPYLNAAAAANIVRADDSDILTKDTPVTRAETAKIIGRTLEYLGKSEIKDTERYISSISDWDNIADAYKAYVAQVYSKGIISGYPDGTFGADKNLTRAEAASIIVRMIDAR